MNIPEAKTAFLFPGQGAQYIGMSRSFYENYQPARDQFDNAVCDFDIKDLCFDGPEETLRETRYSQACIFLASIVIAQMLFDNGIRPDAAAGISLGEYTALCFADSFSVQEGVELLTERGRVMADFIPKDSGMAVVLALDSQQVADACEEVGQLGACEIASYITSERTVITGNLDAVQHAGELCRERGAKMVIPVNASGAFHSVLAERAASEFEKVMQDYEIDEPSLPVYFNYDGSKKHSNIKKMEVGQLQNSVQFVATVQNMLKDGIRRFISIGPGATMASFVQDTAKAQKAPVETYVVDTYEDAKKLIAQLGINS